MGEQSGVRPKVAILVVNGFDHAGRWGTFRRVEAIRFPWIELCLSQVTRYSLDADYRVLVYDNSQLPSHRRILERVPRVEVVPDADALRLARSAPDAREQLEALCLTHPDALDALVACTTEEDEYLVTLDTDAFPIRPGWISTMVRSLDAGASLTGVYRDEMAATLRPFIHVSCLCIRRDVLLGLQLTFGQHRCKDVGQNITFELEDRGAAIAPLRRSNGRNVHFLMGGIYGDLVYHNGAGSRKAVFFTSDDLGGDEAIRVRLRDFAFGDLGRLIAVLRGDLDDNFGITHG